MKYIKKFNEELDSNTYRKAADTLLKLKHNKRAEALKKHATIMTELNKLNTLNNNLKIYKPFGIFDAGLNERAKIKEQFALKLWYDDWTFDESYQDYCQENSSYFWIRISTGLLPLIEEKDLQKLNKFYSEINLDDNMTYIKRIGETDTVIGNICNYFNETFYGIFNGPDIYVNMAIENDKIIIKRVDVDNDGETTLDILGRKSGAQFKNLLIKLFSDNEFNFPSDNQNLQQVIKNKLCEETGFSEKYQFELSEIGEFIKKESINKFYNTFSFVN